MRNIASRRSRNACRVPHGFSMDEAAALPETFFTVWHNLFERGAWRKGESVLIHGGSSGIGTAAIQLAREFGAGAIFATAGSGDKCQACEKLRRDPRASTTSTRISPPSVKEATGNRGVDVVLDMVGGDYLQRNLSILAMEGAAGHHRVPARRQGRDRFRPGDAASV